MDFLYGAWLGTPLWLWLSFFGIVVTLLVLDLGVLHKDDHEIGVKESLWLSAGYISLGLAFGGFVWWQLGQQAAVEYVTGFVVEKSLAMDNVFVIAMIFTYFAIPRLYQHRVLFWGILGVIILRGIMIGFGAAIVTEWSWVLYIFAAFLIFTGVKMWIMAEEEYDVGDSAVLKWVRGHVNVTKELHGNRFFVKQPDPKSGKLVTWITPLFLALIMVEFVDVVFAIDSVPAIFAITTDPFIVYTSNIFAILGLRSMYFMLAEAVERFKYLKYGLSLVLVLIGFKIIWNFGLSKELKMVPYMEPHWSLIATLLLLGGSIAYSLWRTGKPDVKTDVKQAD